MRHLAFAPDGSLVTANDDGRVAVWEPRTGHLIRAFQIVPRAKDAGSFSGVARVVPSPEGSRLAVLTYSRGVLPALPASRSLDSMRQDAAG